MAQNIHDTESGPKIKNPINKNELNWHLKKAIDDVQYLIDYVTKRFPNDVDRNVVKTLIGARRRIEKQEDLSLDEEASFWVAYQKLCRQISPVTAESIKANQPTSKNPAGRVKGGISARQPMSKSRKVMAWYIFLTALAFLVVLSFQIYWVIGNQLSTQLAGLIQEEYELNPNAYVDKTLYEKDLNSLKGKILQTSAIFLTWSKPWIDSVSPDEFDLFGGNKQQITIIDRRIKEINDQLQEDPDGQKTAKNDPEILQLLDQNDEVTKKLALVQEQESLKIGLAYSDEQITLVQEQIDTINDSIEIENAKLAEIKAAKDAEINAMTTRQDGLKLRLEDIRSQLNDASNTEPEKSEPGNPDENLDTNVRKCLPDLTDEEKIGRLVEKARSSIENIPQLITDCNDTLGLIETINGQIEEKRKDTQEEQSVRENLSNLKAKINKSPENVVSFKFNIESNSDIKKYIYDEVINTSLTWGTKLDSLISFKNSIQSQNDSLQRQIDEISIDEDKVADKEGLTSAKEKIGRTIVTEWENEITELEGKKYELRVEAIKDDARPAQLAGQFVLDILEKYLLPLFYGILGAMVFALRSLSRQVESSTYSDATQIQHVSHIALGALSGVLVGWFSNLFAGDSFLSSVSPMAIAFLVGYNIELVFSKIDEYVVTRVRDLREKTSEVSETVDLEESQPEPEQLNSGTSIVEENTENTNTPEN